MDPTGVLLLPGKLLLCSGDNVRTQTSAGNIRLGTPYGLARLRCVRVRCRSDHLAAVGPHHRRDVDRPVKGVALPSRHDVAVFLLALAARSALVCRSDYTAEVADRIPWRCELSHFHGTSA